jgi:hypothetical protein
MDPCSDQIKIIADHFGSGSATLHGDQNAPAQYITVYVQPITLDGLPFAYSLKKIISLIKILLQQ